MKQAFLILVMLVVGGNALAQLKEPIEKTACYYVYIDRISPDVNGVKGQNEKGDVIDIIPCEKITPPDHDFKNFNLIKMQLTETQKADLMKPLLSTETDELGNLIVLKERATKLDVSLLTEKKEYTKDEIYQSIINKSIDTVVSK